MTFLIWLVVSVGWLVSGFCALLFMSVRFRWFDSRLPDSALGTLPCILFWPAVLVLVSMSELVRGRKAQA